MVITKQRYTVEIENSYPCYLKKSWGEMKCESF
jgi:hypothetical protein